MFSQDDGTDGIQHTTHSTPHEAGGRPSPLQAAAATPCPAPGHGDVGGIPWSPAGTKGGAIHTPLTSHSLPQTLFGAAQRVSWPDRWTDLAGAPATVSPEPSATPRRAGGVPGLSSKGSAQRVARLLLPQVPGTR